MKPLAVILRPQSLDDIVGQKHLVGKDAKLRKLIESGKLASILLFGPAGTGKTSIAETIAKHTESLFIRLNATQAKIADIRKCGENAKKLDKPVVIFCDEIHRLTRVSQDAFLPYVEDGHIVLVGATTSNPFHSVDSALLSRMQLICELEPLTQKELGEVLLRGVKFFRAQNINISIDSDASRYILNISNGDARKVLSTLEVVVAVAEDANNPHIDLELVKAVSPSKHMVFGDQVHFDIASAHQGSLQASDPDAAVYWLAKWLESGEDPRYIARRLMISASEDACSTPQAAIVAQSAYIAACEIGRPECDIILAHATVVIATAPRNKSAACAIWSAIKDIRNKEVKEVPKEMKDSHYPGAEKLGHGAYHDGMNQEKYVGINKKYYRPEKWVL